MWWLFKDREKKIKVVCDVGTYEIKLCKLNARSYDHIDLEDFWVVRSPTELAVSTYIENPIVEPRVVEDTFRKLIKDAGLSYQDIYLILPDHAALVSLFYTSPGASEEQINESLKSEFQPILQLPVEYWYFRYQKIGNFEEQDLMLGVGVIKNNIIELGGIVQKAGLNPYVVDISSFNLYNILEPYITSEENSEKNIAVINLGYETTTIGIFHHGYLKTYANRSIGGYDFTRQISEHFHVGMEDAENFKRSETFFLSEFVPEQDELYNYNVIRSVFEELVRQIFATFEYFLTRFRELTIHEVIIAGGGANFKNINVILQGHLNIPVKKVGDIVKITRRGEDLSVEDKNILAMACGAFLREL